MSNISLAISGVQQRQIHRREGDVLCLLISRPGLRKLERLNFDGQGALVAVLNISCDVYPVGKTRAAQVQHVVAALKQIERRYSRRRFSH